ncbi:hypothetical protein [Streptomyces radicis]|uniref:hypothetical protein n=1 Tax=Streptomyces radicis TaxID=1750517 RepID=UPI001C7D1F7F|nr:hypothetical protein [Streptomyces radicis]
MALSVFDRGAGGPFQRPGLSLGRRTLPPITTRSFTDLIAERVRAHHPPGTGPVGNVVTHNVFAEDDAAIYLGAGGRAAVVVRLTPALRPDLYGLGEAIEDNGASLYLDAHAGFLRASLLLPALDFDLDTGMLLDEGNVQEFLWAAYTTETVELHISHAAHDRLLPFTCAAPGIRAVLDAGFDLITLPAPADPRAEVAAVNGTLNPSALVPLRVTGRAELAITFDVEA